MDVQTSPDPQSGEQVVKISPEIAEQLGRVEGSIQRWAMEHIRLALEMRGVESTVHTLQELKMKLLTDALKEHGVDAGKFQIARITADGITHLVPSDTGSVDHVQDLGAPRP